MTTTTAMTRMLSFFFLYTLVFHSLPASSHMQMSNPYPLRSPLDPNTASALKDYDYTTPLNTDGSDYPCKGYQHDSPLRTTATYEAGGTYQMTLQGSASHLGGSCQLALSYDAGASFRVIKSMIGGCPKTKEYAFTIPTSAPAGTALFAWTWFNFEGNREFYMNCAAVSIVNNSSSSSGQLGESGNAAFAALPDIWKANIAGTNCRTTARQNVVFPAPGPDVLYADGMSAADPPTPGDCEGSGMQSSNPVMTLGQPASPTPTSAYDEHAEHYEPTVYYESPPASSASQPQHSYSFDDGQYRWKAPTSALQFAETPAAQSQMSVSTGVGVVTETTTSCPPTTTRTPTTLETVWRPASSSSASPPPPPPASPPPQQQQQQQQQQQPPASPGYATTDLSAYLPCTPGTILCTSPSAFLTCDQRVPGTSQYGWEYLYPRSVAEGMVCAPLLVPCSGGGGGGDGEVGCGTGAGAVPGGYYRDDRYVRAGS